MLAPLLASCCYCYATWLLHRNPMHVRRVTIAITMAGGFAAHAFEIFSHANGFLHDVSVTNVLTFVSLCMTLICVVRYFTHNDRVAYPIVALVAAASVWSPIILPAPATIVHGWALKMHISLSIAAYISLGFAALYSCFLLVQDYRLRHGLCGFDFAISLNDLERAMMSFTRFGEALLTLAIATGMIFIHDFWSQHLMHKLSFGIISWVIIASVLLRHHLRGFRGRPAALWVLGGFACLVLSYFGSAFVLQIFLY